MKGFNERAKPPPNHQKELVRLIASLSPRHSTWQVFSDFVEVAAISISNTVDIRFRNAREARYMEVIKRYRPDELCCFPEMIAHLVEALGEAPSDVLGRTFHDLELHNKYAGQFFTPYDVCRMMARMMLDESVNEKVAERGFVTAMEPAAGGGAMLIALAHEMGEMGINYQRQLHATAVDVDLKCVHMAYVQLALLHIPATVIHGNSLTLEEFGYWETPAHFMSGWDWKLRRRSNLANEKQPDPEAVAPEARTQEPLMPVTQLTLF